MGFRQITLGKKPVLAHKAIIRPDFKSRTVLVKDTWEYVAMWLKRLQSSQKYDAMFFWEQARHFSDASRQLPKTSSPLASYYCFLNAIKALLTVKRVGFGRCHGVTGKWISNRACLASEKVTFQQVGVLAALCKYLGESANGQSYSLKDLLYNLPYIHRAYNLTYSSQPELFIPVENPRFVKKNNATESWFCVDVADRRYKTKHVENKLPTDYERDRGVTNKFVIRKKKRFKWYQPKYHKAASMQRLIDYHRTVRRQLYYIHGDTRLWYLKRSSGPPGVIQRSSLTITFAAMHRLSELTRYEPKLLAKHFECQHNWLLSEFITTSREQFLDEVSSEITGQDFMTPGRRSNAPTHVDL